MNQTISGIPILTYHKITAEREYGINTVSPGQFLKQMQFLQDSGYNPVTFRDVKHGQTGSRPVIITFDDGYASVYENALEILDKFDFQSVIFIISGYIGQKNSWDANLGRICFSHLTENQMRELAQNGMELGSHGVSHRALNFLKDEEIGRELSDSRYKISEYTDQEVMTIAYPFGLQNPRIRQLAQEVGYHYGCINLWGGKTDDNPYRLRRIPVYRTDSLISFKRKLSSTWKNRLELSKLKILSTPALLTPLYQKLFKHLY